MRSVSPRVTAGWSGTLRSCPCTRDRGAGTFRCRSLAPTSTRCARSAGSPIMFCPSAAAAPTMRSAHRRSKSPTPPMSRVEYHAVASHAVVAHHAGDTRPGADPERRRREPRAGAAPARAHLRSARSGAHERRERHGRRPPGRHRLRPRPRAQQVAAHRPRGVLDKGGRRRGKAAAAQAAAVDALLAIGATNGALTPGIGRLRLQARRGDGPRQVRLLPRRPRRHRRLSTPPPSMRT